MIDGLFIRSLLLAFFFKLLPELIIQHKVYIAEPPLYRVNDKKDPFVKNMVDYNSRYVKAVSKDYKIGYMDGKSIDADMLDKDTLTKFLNETRHYEEDMLTLASHYKCRDRFCNERLLEMILEEFIYVGYDGKIPPSEILKRINIQLLNNRIGEMFNEIYFDDKDTSFKGVIDAQPQYIELSEELIIDSREILDVLKDWVAPREGSLVLKENRTGIEHKVSVLEALKILHKYKPETVHRFKGLGENAPEDIRETIMDPNTRMLIRVNSTDIENDMRTFQILRGDSKKDLMERKMWMKEFKFDRDMIDT